VALATQRQRIERVEAAVRHWDRGDAIPPRPPLTRQALVELRLLLLEELVHLKGLRPPTSMVVLHRPTGDFSAARGDDTGDG
jgi:hypothetical protein